MPAVFVNGLINKHLKHLKDLEITQSNQPNQESNQEFNQLRSLQALTFQTWPDTSKALINEQGVLRASQLSGKQPGNQAA